MKGKNTEKTAALKEQAKEKFCVCWCWRCHAWLLHAFVLWLQARKPRRHQLRTERSQGT